MRRADRLFQIVQHLRGGRLVTAQKLGAWLEVSERTIYRDIADLQSTGVPIDGEAGVGYMMREGFDLPPLMFTRDEIVALVAGARMVRAFGGAAMARAADEALVKIGAVLPDAEKDRIARTEIHTPMWVVSDADRERDRPDRARRREARGADARLSRRGRPRPRRATSARSACGSGARSGRWSPGARCATISAPSASTASPASSAPAAPSSRSAASSSPISTARWSAARNGIPAELRHWDFAPPVAGVIRGS